MNRRYTHFISAFKRLAETGFTVAIQSIYYTMMIFVFFALIFDFGNVGYVYTISSNAARLAAQDAAKDINQDAFINSQLILLNDDAVTRAQDFVSEMTNGKMTIVDVSLSQPDKKYILVRAMVNANLPVLNSLFGMQPVQIPVQAFAEPAYGINEEGQ
jgi:hypothetical protein